MKLHEKHEIDQLKAQEKKREIDEGLKLARRVDDLRKLEAEERTRITSWRKVTLEGIRLEIESKIKERDALKKDIERERATLAELRIPLDAQWEKVHEEAAKLRDLSSDFEEREENLNQRLGQLEAQERIVEVEKGKVDELRHQTLENHQKSKEVLTHSREEAATMRNDAQLILAKNELQETLLRERELAVAIRERDVENKSVNINKYEKKLLDKEWQLKDLEQSLLKAKKELAWQTQPKMEV